jgi:ABC-2 type transport system permease protein
MTSVADDITPPTSVPQDAAPAAFSWRRLLYWSVRRELWENRSVYVAPLVIAAVALLGVMLSSFSLPHALRAIEAGDARRALQLSGPYSFVAFAVMATEFFVAVFYSLAALHGERRDRSILFWKSLPVSDTVTVLSKAAIPIAVVPVLTFAIAFAAQVLILFWTTLVALLNGFDPTLLWSHLNLHVMWIMLPYGLFVDALWTAPVYAWFILVSGWAKRMPILWAVAPFVVPAMFEKGAFGTAYIGQFLGRRVFGGFSEAYGMESAVPNAFEALSRVNPIRTFSSPDIWLGLLAAAALLAAAVWLRRRSQPI